MPFDPEQSSGWNLLLEKGWDNVIAWSLGAHLCLKHLRSIRAKRLFLIAPFLDFCQGTSREKVLEMISGLDKNPGTTMRWFWKLCGIKNPPNMEIIDRQQLKLCLKFLCQSRVDPGLISSDLPVTLIHGLKDRIVPVQVSEKILECLPYACYLPLPYGHFIPEKEIIKAIYEQSDQETL